MSMPAVNPKILEWARETAGLTLDAAAQKLGIQPAKGVPAVQRLGALEAGTEIPSRAMLVKMAHHYRRPLLVFYMSAPPRRADRGSDFRTLPQRFSKIENALLDALIRDVTARQSMVRAVLEEEDEAERIAFIGSVKISDGVQAIVDSMRRTLAFELSGFRAQSTPGAAFTLLREKVETAGVFVLLIGNLGSHHSSIGLELFRGFAVADDVAPFVVINDQDAHSAWSFTLMHELTHLWLGQTGVSGSEAESAIERFCNDVASEFLLPAVELLQLSVNDVTDAALAESRIQAFARECNVSGSMVAYKLFRTDAISFARWETLSRTFRKHWVDSRASTRQQARSREGGPNYYVVRRHRVGDSLIRLVNRMMAAGALTTTKAGAILGVKPQNVYTLLNEVDRFDGSRAA